MIIILIIRIMIMIIIIITGLQIVSAPAPMAHEITLWAQLK